jgi:hypothetical protein
MNWRKSSYSASNGGCVEIAWPQPTSTAVRDSKQTAGPTLSFATPIWHKFLTTIAAAD